MTIFNNFTKEIISTVVILIIVLVLRFIISTLVRRFARKNESLEIRANLIIKYIDLLINILAAISLIVVWGVDKKDVIWAISSVTTVVGVAMFAQWSILSNITSGIILFFFFPFKIGDIIEIHDKDFPVKGTIEDINAFHVYLTLSSGEKATYPNNMLLQKGISIFNCKFEDKEFTD